jgi:hypothetical protein
LEQKQIRYWIKNKLHIGAKANYKIIKLPTTPTFCNLSFFMNDKYLDNFLRHTPPRPSLPNPLSLPVFSAPKMFRTGFSPQPFTTGFI